MDKLYFKNHKIFNPILVDYILKKDNELSEEGLTSYEWCGLNPKECVQVLDPFKWDENPISEYIKKNTYDLIIGKYPEIDKESVVIGWTNILWKNKTNPGWHQHYYGDTMGDSKVISGNYYADAEGTSTKFEDEDGNVTDVESVNGTCILFDGSLFHTVSNWKNWDEKKPRLGFAFDVIPRDYINNEYNTEILNLGDRLDGALVLSDLNV